MDAAARALELWSAPALAPEVCARYAPRRQAAAPGLSEVTLADLFATGLLPAGTKLISQFKGQLHEAVIDEEGDIVLANGERFSSPSTAAIRAVELSGGAGSRNGWTCWTLEDGRTLDELRRAFAAQQPANSPAGGPSATEQKRIAYWDGLYGYVSELPTFAKAFGDPNQLKNRKEAWTDFPIGVPNCHPDAKIAVKFGWIGLEVWCGNVETYAALHQHLGKFEALAIELNASLQADDVEEARDGTYLKKTRTLNFKRAVDWSAANLHELYAWHATGLLRLREVILGILS